MGFRVSGFRLEAVCILVFRAFGLSSIGKVLMVTFIFSPHHL